MNFVSQFWSTLSLKYKSAIIFGGISVIPLLILSGFTFLNTSKLLHHQLEVDMREVILSKEGRIDSYYKLAFKNADALARDQKIQAYLKEGAESGLSHEEASDVVLNYQESHWGNFHHLFVANTLGEVVISPPHNGSGHAHLGENISSSPFFNAAKNAVQLTDFFGFEESTHYHQLLLYPVKGENGESLGVIAFEVVIDHVLEMLKSDSTSTSGGEVFFATLEGREIVHNKDVESRTFQNLYAMEEGEERFGEYVNSAGLEVFGYYEHLNEYPMILGYEIPSESALAVLHAQTWRMIFLAIGCLVLLLMLCYWMAGYATKRLDQMAQVAKKNG